MLYANTTPFYIRNLGIPVLVSEGVLESIPSILSNNCTYL